MADGAAIAAAGMSSDIQRINIISHNLANTLTPAYKRMWAVSTGFDALMAPNGKPEQAGNPAGVETSSDFRPAPSRHTGNPLDIAIEGDAFFELHDTAGPTIFTRQGSLALDAGGRLVAPGGAAVAGMGGDIRLESDQVRIDRAGRILDKDTVVGQIKLVRFDDARKLVPAGLGRYTQGSALAEPAGESTVLRQGHVEASNVVPADEMVRLIETMRHFEGGQKIMQWYDDMLEQALSRLGQY
jgi:flagellar basal-body rod protein FlgF